MWLYIGWIEALPYLPIHRGSIPTLICHHKLLHLNLPICSSCGICCSTRPYCKNPLLSCNPENWGAKLSSTSLWLQELNPRLSFLCFQPSATVQFHQPFPYLTYLFSGTTMANFEFLLWFSGSIFVLAVVVFSFYHLLAIQERCYLISELDLPYIYIGYIFLLQTQYD